MKSISAKIEGIPAILWGSASNNLIIAVHGDQSNKADDIIKILADVAVKKGYQVLSFDLPEHGDRKEENRLCSVQNCVKDLKKVIRYAQTISKNISLFGCSMGAYFSMLAYQNEKIKQTLFISPVVDMKRIIDNMMSWFDINEERLKKEQEIITPMKTLYWDYYQYVLDHPITWDKPTYILYGAKDSLCEFIYVNSFAERMKANLTILEYGEHFMHTKEQLIFVQEWLTKNVI